MSSASDAFYTIDRDLYAVPTRVMTGKEIRHMRQAPDSNDLYLERTDEDVLVTDSMLIPYVVGRRFYTVPKYITAGGRS